MCVLTIIERIKFGTVLAALGLKLEESDLLAEIFGESECVCPEDLGIYREFDFLRCLFR